MPAVSSGVLTGGPVFSRLPSSLSAKLQQNCSQHWTDQRTPLLNHFQWPPYLLWEETHLLRRCPPYAPASPPVLSLRSQAPLNTAGCNHTPFSFKSLCLHMQFFQPSQLSSSFVLKSHPSSMPSSKVTWMWHLPWPHLLSPCCLSSPACLPAECFVQAAVTPLVSESCLCRGSFHLRTWASYSDWLEAETKFCNLCSLGKYSEF